MIDRLTFLTGAIVATGGLDIWDPPVPAPSASSTPKSIRVSASDGTVPTLDLETYLRGVVPLETSPSWPAAALQAQAILARTYAVGKKTLARGYDLTASQNDQRYGGRAAEHPATTAAVDATRGLTLGFNGGPASVFYSACCGGHSEDAAEVWGHTTLPYLRGVADPYCIGAPDYRWSRDVAVDRARTALALPGAPVSILLDDPDPSGRPRTATVRCDGGTLATLPVVDVRARLGADVVRSTWLRTITVQTTQAAGFVRIEGSGRGHGVGLCQWGARGMALAGADAGTILAQYFPGTAVTGG